MLKPLIKTSISRVDWLHKQYRYNSQAENALKIIELEKGKIDPQCRKSAEEYARDVLGWKGFAPWLKTYSAVAGKFKEGWIPFNYYMGIVRPRILLPVSQEKTLASKLLNMNNFPDVAYYISGLFFDSAWEVLSPEKLKGYIFDFNNKIVYKQSNTTMGMGIHIFTQETFSLDAIYKMGNGIFQKYIQQHIFFEEIMSGSLATLRLNSVVESGGKISCRSAILKIGRTGDSCVSPTSSINVPVDLVSGELHEKGYYLNWSSAYQHPDTKIGFKGKIIPKFNECIAYVIKLHKSIPFNRAVGWDITVDKNEKVQFIEWEEPSTQFAEAAQGPCFADMGWEKIRNHWVFND